MTRLTATVLLLALAAAAPVSAQSGGYVSASLVGDVARFDQYDCIGQSDSGNGEALGFALRVGSALRARWGVELEFVRPGEITSEMTPEFLPLSGLTVSGVYEVIPSSVGVPPLPPDSLALPVLLVQLSHQAAEHTLPPRCGSASGCRRNSRCLVSGRHRLRPHHARNRGHLPADAIAHRADSRSVSSESTTYDVSPVVGIEGSIVLTEHVQLIPGVRLHGIDGGWLLRPAIGLGWVF